MRKIYAKRAQIHSQVFVYILALVVVGVIALIGLQSIHTIIQKKSMIELASFKKDFRDSIASHTNWNEVEDVEFRLPGKAVAICFYDAKASLVGNLNYQKAVIKQMSGVNNVFIVKNKNPISASNVEAFHVDKLRLNTKYLCLPAASGVVRIKMTGLGVKGTRIS